MATPGVKIADRRREGAYNETSDCDRPTRASRACWFESRRESSVSSILKSAATGDVALGEVGVMACWSCEGRSRKLARRVTRSPMAGLNGDRSSCWTTDFGLVMPSKVLDVARPVLFRFEVGTACRVDDRNSPLLRLVLLSTSSLYGSSTSASPESMGEDIGDGTPASGDGAGAGGGPTRYELEKRVVEEEAAALGLRRLLVDEAWLPTRGFDSF